MHTLDRGKSFLEPVRINCSNFENETLFLSFVAIITTKNGSGKTTRTSNNQILVKCVRFQRGLIVAKPREKLSEGRKEQSHVVTTCDRGYLCHIASSSIHPRWRPNPEIEWHHGDTRGTSS